MSLDLLVFVSYHLTHIDTKQLHDKSGGSDLSDKYSLVSNPEVGCA